MMAKAIQQVVTQATRSHGRRLAFKVPGVIDTIEIDPKIVSLARESYFFLTRLWLSELQSHRR